MTNRRSLPDAAARRTIETVLDRNLFVEAAAGTGKTRSLVDRMVAMIRDGATSIEHLSAVVIAYEPIWAIGTGRAATPEGANATIAIIRRTMAEIGGAAVANGLQVQYGGSVTAENFGAFIAQPDIDGALVGGASLKADQFVEIVRLASLNA